MVEFRNRRARHSGTNLPAARDILPDHLGSANSLSIDDAAFIELKPGVKARYGLIPLASLVPNPHAVLVHPQREIKKLKRSIEVAGSLSPIVADEGYMILAGHARAEAQSGVHSVPVLQVYGLSEAEKRIFQLADNRVGEDARLDREKLADQIPELIPLLEDAGFELSDTGFEVAETDELILDFSEQVDPLDVIDEAILDELVFLRRGDIIQLGPHRLAVGDAQDQALLDRLMGDEKAAASFLDVPYNVKVATIGGRGRMQHPEFAYASGEMSRAEYIDFLTTVLGNAARVSKQGAVHYVCTDWKHVRDLIEVGEKVYGAYLTLVVWNKTNAGQGGLYRNQHELIGVFRVGSEPHQDNVQKGRFGNRSNVWTYAGANAFGTNRLNDLASHPTVKPIQLVADALRDVTSRGAIVLDTVVGSGTTILAGEKIGRVVRAIEYEPRYAQIAVRRWEAATGRQAVVANTGQTLQSLSAERNTSSEGSDPSTDGTFDPGDVDAPPAPRVRVRTRK